MPVQPSDKITVCKALLEELAFRADKDNLITLGVDESIAGAIASEWVLPRNTCEDLLTYLQEGVMYHYPGEDPAELPYDVWHLADVKWETLIIPEEKITAFKEAFGREIGYQAGLLQLDVGEELYDCSCGKVDVNGVALDSEECIHHGDRCGACGAFIIEACEVGDGDAMYHGRNEDCRLVRRLTL